MQRKLLGIISVDFNGTGQLLIIYFAFANYMRKKQYNEAVHHLFIDFRRAYESVWREILYNILTGFSIPMKMVKLMKICRNETYSRVHIGKYLSGMFPFRRGLKQGDTLSPLLFNCELECAIRRVQVNQYGLKLNGTHQLSGLC